MKDDKRLEHSPAKNLSRSKRALDLVVGLSMLLLGAFGFAVQLVVGLVRLSERRVHSLNDPSPESYLWFLATTTIITVAGALILSSRKLGFFFAIIGILMLSPAITNNAGWPIIGFASAIVLTYLLIRVIDSMRS